MDEKVVNSAEEFIHRTKRSWVLGPTSTIVLPLLGSAGCEKRIISYDQDCLG